MTLHLNNTTASELGVKVGGEWEGRNTKFKKRLNPYFYMK